MVNVLKGSKLNVVIVGGEHSAAYKGCEVHKRAVQVQNVRMKERISCAEAIKKVDFKTRSNLGPRIGLAPVIQNPSQKL